jgi:hypothetical protein
MHAGHDRVDPAAGGAQADALVADLDRAVAVGAAGILTDSRLAEVLIGRCGTASPAPSRSARRSAT